MHPLAAELNRTTDELNKLYEEVTKRFAVYGIEASVPMKRGESSLEFRKHGNMWRLMVCQGDASQPLLSSSRRMRIEAAAHVPALFDQVIQNATVEVEYVTTARLTLRSFLELPE